MTKIASLLPIVPILLLSVLPTPLMASGNENSTLLPSPFKVYYSPKSGILNHPFAGGVERLLPTNNDYKKSPGCYIACYSHNESNSVYPVAKDIFVMGQIRVPGTYVYRVCRPQGYESKDISAEQHFKQLCQTKLSTQCGGLSCWAGGDTGGWFGVQE